MLTVFKYSVRPPSKSGSFASLAPAIQLTYRPVGTDIFHGGSLVFQQLVTLPNHPRKGTPIMLCIGRKLFERVIITVPPSTESRQVEITLARINTHSVRLAFSADRDIEIYREELGDPRLPVTAVCPADEE